jgi:thymidine kinase
MADITLITGPMFAGKSTNLVELLLRSQGQAYHSYLFIKSNKDRRGFITHNKAVDKRLANSRHNIEFATLASLNEVSDYDIDSYRTIFIDELHLFEADGAVPFFEKVLRSTTALVATALNGSSEQASFESVSLIMPFISSFQFLTARCYNDNEDGSAHPAATYTKWIGRKNKRDLIEVEYQNYVPCCWQCLKL